MTCFHDLATFTYLNSLQPPPLILNTPLCLFATHSTWVPPGAAAETVLAPSQPGKRQQTQSNFPGPPSSSRLSSSPEQREGRRQLEEKQDVRWSDSSQKATSQDQLIFQTPLSPNSNQPSPILRVFTTFSFSPPPSPSIIVLLLEACKGERGVGGGRSEGQKTGWEAR